MLVRAIRYRSASLTDPLQGIQDVKAKLKDLIPLVTDLNDTMKKADARDRGEAERRAKLTRFE